MAKGDLKRAFAEDGERKTHIGGQALIEGVMMRGKHNWAVGVRNPDGTLHSEEHPLSKKGDRSAWLSWPLVRGCVALVDSLALGYKALEIAANHALQDEDEADTFVKETPGMTDENGVSGSPASDKGGSTKDVSGEGEFAVGVQVTASSAEDARVEDASDEPGVHVDPAVPDESADDAFGKVEMTIALILGVVMGVSLFVLLPGLASNVLVGEYETNPLAWNIVDGVMRVVIFVFYVWLIGRMKDIKRMFAYHGAEHKTIHCYEHGLELTPENARQFPRLHVRCGTAFLIMVMIIAILVYTIIPLDIPIAALGFEGPAAFALLMVVRIVLMPVIAGISYEITVKWAGSHPDNPLVRVVLWPGMQMQRLTTNEPDDGMLECAIVAMELVLEREDSARS
ncbi:MAG: DUF1385 domain-containing protein [Eggerthellaceae bacterium]